MLRLLPGEEEKNKIKGDLILENEKKNLTATGPKPRAILQSPERPQGETVHRHKVARGHEEEFARSCEVSVQLEWIKKNLPMNS